MFLYPKKSNYPLLPHLSFQKNFIQITLNKGHPYIEIEEGWYNVCICFIWLVVHHYENIKQEEERNDMVISWKEKRKAKVGEWV